MPIVAYWGEVSINQGFLYIAYELILILPSNSGHITK